MRTWVCWVDFEEPSYLQINSNLDSVSEAVYNPSAANNF